MEIKTDVVIVGTGVGGAFSALNLPEDKQILMITKSDLEAVIHFWHRVESVYFGMMRIMRGILKIQCVQVITRTGKNQWIL